MVCFILFGFEWLHSCFLRTLFLEVFFFFFFPLFILCWYGRLINLFIFLTWFLSVLFVGAECLLKRAGSWQHHRHYFTWSGHCGVSLLLCYYLQWILCVWFWLVWLILHTWCCYISPLLGRTLSSTGSLFWWSLFIVLYIECFFFFEWPSK